MFRLSAAIKKEDLEQIIAQLQQDYPTLKEVTYSEKVETAESYDDKIERYVVHLIQTGRAKEALQFPTIAKSVNFDIEQYPEFKNFNQ
jgi:DNA-binding TFAR19-related protein (PDSD5 family)